MPNFHFVEDYRNHVRNLIEKYPLDEAMSLAVGGSYDGIGQIEKALLIQMGLLPHQYIIDVGCGAGRLASALIGYSNGKYLGTDVVKELLDYSHQKCPSHWRFELVEDLTIPEQDNTADFVCFLF